MRTVFFGRVTTAGAFAANTAPTPNPFNPVANTCTPARSGAGAYTLTFGQAYPITEYKISYGLEAGAANANMQVSVAGAVLTIGTNVGATPTDEAFWICIEAIGDASAS